MKVHWIFVVLVSVLAAGQSLADEPCDGIGDPVPSQLGLSYERYADPLPAILSQGEAERLSDGVAYAEMERSVRRALRREWRKTLRLLFAGTLPPSFQGGDEPNFDFLRGAAPEMLARLKACGPAADRRLAYLEDVPLEVSGGDVE